MVISLVSLRNGRQALAILMYNQRYIKEQYLAESLLDYALAFSTENYSVLIQQLKNNKKPITIKVGNWPPAPLAKLYIGQYSIKNCENSGIKIDAILYTKDSVDKVTHYSCSLVYEVKQNKFFVKDWHKHSV